MQALQFLFKVDGRIRRSTWWLSKLALGMTGFVIVSVIAAAYPNYYDRYSTAVSPITWLLLLLLLVSCVTIYLASLTLDVRRWHDLDKSGWWVFIVLVPIIGPLWTLIECGLLDGTQGPNRFGPSPKGIDTGDRSLGLDTGQT